MEERIKIYIPNGEVPMFMPFHPSAAGGTMLIRRLCRYLMGEGYSIRGVESFLNVPDYPKRVKDFIDSINSDIAAQANCLYDIYLLEVCDSKGHSVMYLLDMSGEYQVNLFMGDHDRAYPLFFHQIVTSNNPIIWAYIFDPSCSDVRGRKIYADVIQINKLLMKRQDTAFFIYNKIDLTPFVVRPGEVVKSKAVADLRNMYPGIYDVFKRKFLGGLISASDVTFVPFSTGRYATIIDESGYCSQAFLEGPNDYPAGLWRKLMKTI